MGKDAKKMVIMCVVIKNNLLPAGATIYLATKNQTITPELNKKMRDDFPGASEHCEYVHLDVTQGETVEAVKEMIVARHDTLDILINNAGRYEVPDPSAPAKFGEQTDLIVGTNYWGLKRVVAGVRGVLTPGARLVNVSSHLGHLSLINGEAKAAMHLRETLADPDVTEKKLGEFIQSYCNC